MGRPVVDWRGGAVAAEWIKPDVPILKDLWQSLKPHLEPFDALFSSIARHPGQWMVGLSIVLFPIARSQGWETVAAISLSVGAGGMFTWLTKSVVFRGVLRDEIINAAYKPENLASLQPEKLEQLFSTVLCAYGFPKNTQITSKTLVERLWKQDIPYYYKELRRTHKLSWEDPQSGILRVTTEYTAKLVNTRPDQAASVGQRIREKRGLDRRLEPNLEQFKIEDTAARGSPQTIGKFEESQDHGSVVYGVSAPLPKGAQNVRLDVRWSYTQRLQEDNTVMFEAQCFCEHLIVEVEFDPAAMTVIFSPSGGRHQFEDRGDTEGQMKRECAELILPFGGYMLSIQRSMS